MDDFLFENKFCQHFKYLRENSEVFVSFNIDWCQSIMNDKITISLYYNDNLDVENEKSKLDKFAVKCKFNEWGWRIPCEIFAYVSDFHHRRILFNQEFACIITFEFKQPIDKIFTCYGLADYKNRRQNWRQQWQYSKLSLVFWL